MPRTWQDLLSSDYNRHFFSDWLEFPADRVPFLEGVKLRYNLGRVLSLADDTPALFADLREEYDAEKGRAWPDEAAPPPPEWEEWRNAWLSRVRCRKAAFVLEEVIWSRPYPPPSPADPASYLRLEPAEWLERGQTLVLEVLTSPDTFKEVLGLSPFPCPAPAMRSTTTFGILAGGRR